MYDAAERAAEAVSFLRYGRLIESPFTDLTPQRSEGLFSSSQIDELMHMLEGVQPVAMAA